MACCSWSVRYIVNHGRVFSENYMEKNDAQVNAAQSLVLLVAFFPTRFIAIIIQTPILFLNHIQLSGLFLPAKKKIGQRMAFDLFLVWNHKAWEMTEYPWSPSMLYLDHDWQYLMCTVRQELGPSVTGCVHACDCFTWNTLYLVLVLFLYLSNWWRCPDATKIQFYPHFIVCVVSSMAYVHQTMGHTVYGIIHEEMNIFQA